MMLGLANSLVSPSAAVIGGFPLVISNVALTGDSITEATATGLNQFNGGGYGGQTRALMGSVWNMVPDTPNSKLTFATGGKRADEVYALHLAAVLASSADMVIDAPGLNDAVQAISAATVAANRLEAWLAIRARGKWCIPLAIIPMPIEATAPTYPDNGAGAISARIVAINAACAAAAAAIDFPYVDVSTPLEATPGTGDGIGDLANFDATRIHPNSLGALKMGRALDTYLAANFTFGVDPLTGTPITNNQNFSADPWSTHNRFAPTNGTLGTQSKNTADGYTWWRNVLTKGTSTNAFTFLDLQSNVVAPASQQVRAVAVFRVVSGTVSSLQLSYNTNPGNTLNGRDLADSSAMNITSADGIIVLRTQLATIASGATQTFPTLSVIAVADATIEIGYLGCIKSP